MTENANYWSQAHVKRKQNIQKVGLICVMRSPPGKVVLLPCNWDWNIYLSDFKTSMFMFYLTNARWLYSAQLSPLAAKELWIFQKKCNDRHKYVPHEPRPKEIIHPNVRRNVYGNASNTVRLIGMNFSRELKRSRNNASVMKNISDIGGTNEPGSNKWFRKEEINSKIAEGTLGNKWVGRS